MRARINQPINVATQNQRIIAALSQIYEIPYNTVRAYYYRYNEQICVTRMHLNRIYVTGNELSIIN